MRFENKVVVVTGAARGIGQATARRFAAEGATVVGVDLEPAEGLLQVDVSKAEAVRALFAGVGRRYGRLDALVANAGRLYSNTTLSATEEEVDACLAANFKSAWLCAREAHPWLVRSPSASIVTVGSYQGLRGGVNTFPYSAAKGALLALTRSLAVEYAPAIRVNAVIPGQVESVRTEPYFNSFTDPAEARRRVLSSYPLGRLGKPDDIAGAILFLASDDASWITGTFLMVDGGRDAALLNLSDLRRSP
jgi:NAD(P)-dependent dehydrogenase (short-subunit alcohol dehydrogenase family)